MAYNMTVWYVVRPHDTKSDQAEYLAGPFGSYLDAAYAGRDWELNNFAIPNRRWTIAGINLILNQKIQNEMAPNQNHTSQLEQTV